MTSLASIPSGGKPPEISVITPVHNPVLSELSECMSTAAGPGVEHVVIMDGRPSADELSKVIQVANRHHARVLVLETQSGISEASNFGVSNSSGEFIVFLDQDGFFEPNWRNEVLTAFREADFVYSDSYHTDKEGTKISLSRKPGWSPVRLISNMYAVHLMAVRREIFERVGGFRSQYDGSQDHDLALRVSRITTNIKHIPKPLYNWRQSRNSTLTNPENKTWAYEAGRLAAQNHIEHLGCPAEVNKIEEYPGALGLKFKKRELPVSVVIPTAFQKNVLGDEFVDLLVGSLLPFLDVSRGDEIILVYGSGEKPKKISKNLENSLISGLKDKKKFNFSRRVNLGFIHAKNDHILLLNDDVQFDTLNPLDSLFGLLDLPNVGLVGGLLAFPDYSIQHGGHTFMDGLPSHAHLKATSLTHGLFDLLVDREVVGVTGALMFQRKSTWRSVGGFCEGFPGNFNDVDYCQKIRTLGASILQANSVTAIHHESATRDSKVGETEVENLLQRWRYAMLEDEFTIPSVKLNYCSPPRAEKKLSAEYFPN